MTTIAYRNGELAGDSLITSDGMRTSTMRKVSRREDGALIGICGRASLIRSVGDWFLAGEKADERPAIKDNEAQFIIVRPNGRVESHDDAGFSDDAAAFHALGSGRDIALGAMAAGASATEAVRLASKIDTRTGGRITTVRK